jgi:hypothetical protein
MVVEFTNIRYSTIETKEFSRIGYNGFLFPHSYSDDGLFSACTHAEKRPSSEYECGKRNPFAEKRPSSEYECGKRNPLYPIRENSFVSIIMYLTCTIIVLLKK